MSNENITPEIMEYAEICRTIVVQIYNRAILDGEYGESDLADMGYALARYRTCLEIMKLEKEL